MSENILNYGIRGFTIARESDTLLSTHLTHALLGGVTGDKIFLKTPLGNLSADGMFLTIANTGVAKSLPVLKAIPMIKKLQISCPSKFTTESLAKWFYDKNEDGNYVNKNYGIIIWDEASKMFSESKKKEFMDGAIEAMSMLHNHYIPSEYYKTADYGVCQDPYVSMIGNMVPQYLGNIPDYFWNQGLAGRILWRFIMPQRPENNGSWIDFQEADNAEKNRKQFEQSLTIVKDFLHSIDPLILVLSKEADYLVQQYKFKIESEWYEAYQLNPWEVDFSYKKRLTELLGKTALRVAIGRYFGEHQTLTGLKTIEKTDVMIALQIINQSDADLQFCFGFINCKPKTRDDRLNHTKIMAVYRLFKAGKDPNYIKSSTNSYDSKLSFQECVAELLKRGKLRPLGTQGTSTIQYEVI